MISFIVFCFAQSCYNCAISTGINEVLHLSIQSFQIRVFRCSAATLGGQRTTVFLYISVTGVLTSSDFMRLGSRWGCARNPNSRKTFQELFLSQFERSLQKTSHFLAHWQKINCKIEINRKSMPSSFFSPPSCFSGLRRNLTICGCVTVSGTSSGSLLRSTSRGGRCTWGCTTSVRSDWGCSPRTFPPLTPTSQKVGQTFTDWSFWSEVRDV